MSTIINIDEAGTHLSCIGDDVAAGAEVVIAKAGKPMARLMSFTGVPRPKTSGPLKDRIRVPGDPPLPNNLLDELGGR